MRILVVDGANVVGSRPDGWWLDRAGAAQRLHQTMATADLGFDATVLVLEGDARHGLLAGEHGGVRTVHAAGSGDDEIVGQVGAWVAPGHDVVVVTADRELRARVTAVGGSVVGPSCLLTGTS